MAIRLALDYYNDRTDTGGRFTMKLLAPRKAVNDIHGDGGIYTVRAVMPRNHDSAMTTRYLTRRYTTHRCGHSHDCCGCITSHCEVKKVSRREYLVTVCWYRNV